jgi:hypothetical protein
VGSDTHIKQFDEIRWDPDANASDTAVFADDVEVQSPGIDPRETSRGQPGASLLPRRAWGTPSYAIRACSSGVFAAILSGGMVAGRLGGL